jgi:signal transduction histidine kinase
MRFTVKRKIIIGLAAILLMGIGSMLVIYHGLNAVAREVQELAEVQEPASAAAYEMEINVNGMGLAVLRYLDSGNPRYHAWVREDIVDFARFHARYTALSKSPEEAALANELGEHYRKFKALSISLMQVQDTRRHVFNRIEARMQAMDHIISRRLPTRRVAVANQQAGTSAAMQLEIELAKLNMWLAHYRASGLPTHRARAIAQRTAFQETLAAYGALDLTTDEARWAAQLRQQFDRIAADLQQILILQESLRRDIARFTQLRIEMDRLLDERVQVLALQNLYLPRQEADDTTERVLQTARFLLPLFVFSGASIAVFFIRTLTRPLQALRDGTVAIGRGDLGFRIPTAGRDEFADLARQFNRMVVQLQVTTVSKELLEMSEEKLHETVANLRREIAERERAEQARVKLEAALRRSETMSAMGALVGGVAHEVRNPLFAISSMLDAMDARFKDREEYRRYTDVLREETNRLNKLMTELLQYGRPVEAELSPGLLPEVIAESVHGCSALAEQTKVKIVNDVRTNDACVMMDRTRLAQVFQNLLQNAIQHSPSGASVTIETCKIQDDEQEWIACAVKDAGSGFAKEDLSRIFEPFFTKRQGGTGLGLSIVQRIVEEHGGTIAARNGPAGGAIMEVRLPVAHAEQA